MPGRAKMSNESRTTGDNKLKSFNSEIASKSRQAGIQRIPCYQSTKAISFNVESDFLNVVRRLVPLKAKVQSD